MAKGVARLGDSISHGGEITGASSNVTANGRKVARKGDPVQCNQHGSQTITGGSSTVKANTREIARLDDPISCGATISSASTTVKAGG